MDVGLLFVILLLTVIPEAEFISTELCKAEHKSKCWYFNGCDIASVYCGKMIECDEWTTINITVVKYGTNSYVNSKDCNDVCNGPLEYLPRYTSNLMKFCNGKHKCELSHWNPNNYWRLYIKYDCKEWTILPKTSMNWMSTAHMPHISEITTKNASPRVVTTPFRNTTKINTKPVKSPTDASRTQVSTTCPQPQQTTTSSNDTESKTDENDSPDQFPVLAVAVSAGIVVLIIVLIVVVCIKRRRRTIKSDQPNENPLQMQIVANNDIGNAINSVQRVDHHETDEHEYVDTALQNDPHTTDGTFEHEYVYLNADKVVNKDIEDDYNTLNTHPAPLRVDPNYDHIPKGSHTTVDETYSHVTDGQTTMPDATYSHLKDTKSALSRNAKSNQNISDNIYNHINTKSVEKNVYNNSQTSFNRSALSHFGKPKAVEDDYDHTDWKQIKPSNSKSKYSNNEAVGKLETKNITERARDEYAVVKKRSDQVESSDGHNYFVLEKQFL